MDKQYNWVGYFEQIADKINQLYEKDQQGFPREMWDAVNNARQELKIDPFTSGSERTIPIHIYSSITRFGQKNRQESLKSLLKWLVIEFPYSEEIHFAGVPKADSRPKDKSEGYRPEDQSTCWNFLKCALDFSKSGFQDEKLMEEFSRLFDRVKLLDGIGNSTLTDFLFYIRPNFYVPYDKTAGAYLDSFKIVKYRREEINAEFYLSLLQTVHKSIKSGVLHQQGIKTIPEFSYQAFLFSEGKKGNNQSPFNKTSSKEIKMQLKEKSQKLIESRNIILRGAPGTGKTYLAKQIAAYTISNGKNQDVNDLSKRSQEQFEFVQFHPSYDYTDFVEGLRPVVSSNKTVGFELQKGIFKAFVEKARKEYEKSPNAAKRYVFVIDEINRGEISKIFGELFFAIDPGYRGPNGSVSTQYANLHANPKEKFYIPENLYIIGTMNDIDRSVDSFDFAMRRRFRFIEIKAEDTAQSILSSLQKDKADEAKQRMKALNQVIAETEGLGTNYQIGAAYFLKLDQLDFEHLWSDYLEPLLSDYVRGMHNEKDLMVDFRKAYEGVGGKPDEMSSN